MMALIAVLSELPSRFLLTGPVPGSTGAFGAASAVNGGHGSACDPAPFGVGRMLFAGSPDTVVEQIRAFQETTGAGVLDLVFSSGQNRPEDIQRSIELFGREVLPRVRGFAASGPTPGRLVAFGS